MPIGWIFREMRDQRDTLLTAVSDFSASLTRMFDNLSRTRCIRAQCSPDLLFAEPANALFDWLRVAHFDEHQNPLGSAPAAPG
jgi:hypothetical protein